MVSKECTVILITLGSLIIRIGLWALLAIVCKDSQRIF